jgi:hypothetical protein
MMEAAVHNREKTLPGSAKMHNYHNHHTHHNHHKPLQNYLLYLNFKVKLGCIVCGRVGWYFKGYIRLYSLW